MGSQSLGHFTKAFTVIRWEESSRYEAKKCIVIIAAIIDLHPSNTFSLSIYYIMQSLLYRVLKSSIFLQNIKCMHFPLLAGVGVHVTIRRTLWPQTQ